MTHDGIVFTVVRNDQKVERVWWKRGRGALLRVEHAVALARPGRDAQDRRIDDRHPRAMKGLADDRAGRRRGPRPSGVAARLCGRLAGEGRDRSSPLPLSGSRIPTAAAAPPRSRCSRGALRDERGVVGYVCWGVRVAGRQRLGGSPSPITSTSPGGRLWPGPTTSEWGPAFPVWHGVYAPEAALTPGGELRTVS